LALLRRQRDAGQPFELTVLDMQMPGTDGLELARQIKADPALSGTRLIMMTSLGKAEHDSELRQAGIVLCLTKPVKQSRLYDAIATAMFPPATLDAPETSVGSSRQTGQDQANPASRSRRAHILIAEDNPVNQKVLLRQLAKMGYNADAVGNGIEVLETLLRIPYDVVLMDCQMPEMDGYAACRELRRRQNNSDRIPIIALTAHAMEGDREKCFAAGMDDYITKPVQVGELQQKLTYWLSRTRREDRAPVADGEPVDMKTLRRVADNDPEFMHELVELYLTEADRQLEALAHAVETGACTKVEEIAHTLAGASITSGMSGVVRPLRELERMGRSQTLADAGVALEETNAQIDRIREFLRSELTDTAPVANT
jgi:two-component system sensor histidine kinase/response regulator